MKPRHMLRFLFGEELRELSGFDPTLTILDWLRLEERKLGTKEGCAEGDCGACTVVVGRLVGGKLRYRAINACIAPLASLDGRLVLRASITGAADEPGRLGRMLADQLLTTGGADLLGPGFESP